MQQGDARPGAIIAARPWTFEVEPTEDGPETLREIVLDVLGERDIPVLGNDDVGHAQSNLPMPLGVRAEMDADDLTMSLLEPAVDAGCPDRDTIRGSRPSTLSRAVPTICVIMDVWSVSTMRRGVSAMGNVEDRERPSDEDSDEWDDGSGEALEEMIEHADRASGAESFGTTADEQERGEPIDARLAEERTDRPIHDTELGLIDEDGPDDEAEMVGEAIGERDPFVAPEDSAMSVRDEAPGAVDHADDHTERDDAGPNAE